MKKKYQSFQHLHLLDPIYAPDKLNVLRSNASLYIHGHSAGGTNPSLVEAMCYGLPIVAFDVVYNRVTTNNEAIYFEDAAELGLLLQNIHNYALVQIGQKLKEVGLKRYQWQYIALKYLNVFKTVSGLKLTKEQVLNIQTKRKAAVKQLASAYLEHKVYNAEKFKDSAQLSKEETKAIGKVS